MKQITLTVEQALAALDAAVADKGADFRYRASWAVGCRYFHGSEPGCIVGHVLHQYGVGRDDLCGLWDSAVGAEVDMNVSYGIRSLRVAGLLDIDDRTESVLTSAQDAQDCGETWGEAVQNAKDVAGR